MQCACLGTAPTLRPHKEPSPFIGAHLLADSAQDGDEVQGQAECPDVIAGGEGLHLAAALGWGGPRAGSARLGARLHRAGDPSAPGDKPGGGAVAGLQHHRANLTQLERVVKIVLHLLDGLITMLLDGSPAGSDVVEGFDQFKNRAGAKT